MFGRNSSEIGYRVRILKSIQLFKEVDSAVLAKIAKELSVTKLLKDEILFNNGDNDYALYIVVSGKVKAHVGAHVYAYFSTFQYFGEYSLLDSSARSTTVTATEDTQLLCLDQKVFFNF